MLNKLKDILKKYYNLKINKVESISNSIAQCYKVTTEDNKYFVKVFLNNRKVERIIQEYDVLKYLREKEFNVPKIINNVDGEVYTSYDNYYLFVEKYIEGYSYINEELPAYKLPLVAHLLGKMHNSLIDEFRDYDKSYWTNLNLNYEEKIIDITLKEIEKCKQNKNYEVVRNALIHKKRLLNKLSEISNNFANLTYVMTHGDYSKRNIIWCDDEISGVVDFSDSEMCPASWELIRSYILSRDKFDYEEFRDYVICYLSEFKLSEIDIEEMPYLLMYQLTLSKYGYEECLENDNEELIKFVKWKEDTIIFLEENADKIVKIIKNSIR